MADVVAFLFVGLMVGTFAGVANRLAGTRHE